MTPEDAFHFIKSKRSHVLLWRNQLNKVEEFARLVNGVSANNIGSNSQT